MEMEKILVSIERIQTKIDTGFREVLVDQATSREKVSNLIAAVEKSDLMNKDQHEKFFNRIGKVEERTAVVESRMNSIEKVDDPASIFASSSQKALLDLLKIIIPLGVMVLMALKIAGKL